MMTTTQAVLTIALIAIATFATRVGPFLLFPANKPTPKYIAYLGKVLPCATMGMLIIYCVKAVQPGLWPHGLPEGIAIALVAVLQYIFKNTLLSIAAGTVTYMLLIQLVFA